MPHRRATNSHSRTRQDHASETAEDYVEAIARLIQTEQRCRVVDLAELFGVSHVTVTKTIARLVKEGLVETQPYGPISLTTAGSRMATESRKRHELVYQFLLALGVSEGTAADDAEGIEHHVSSETLKCFRRFVEQQGSQKSE